MSDGTNAIAFEKFEAPSASPGPTKFRSEQVGKAIRYEIFGGISHIKASDQFLATTPQSPHLPHKGESVRAMPACQ